MLLLGLKYAMGYGQIFLTLFLWLGLWFKVSIHLISGQDYIEATGYFNFNTSEYDELLVVSTVAYFSVCIAWIFAKISLKPVGIKIPLNLIKKKANEINVNLSVKTLACFSGFVLLINLLNWHYGILTVGLSPKTVLPWPSNSIISMLLGDGFPLIISTLLLAALVNNKNINIVIFIVLFEAVLTSITTLSRGAIIWHALPVFIVVFFNLNYFKKIISKKVVVGFILLSIISFIGSIVAANFTRNVQYAVRQSNLTSEFEGQEAILQMVGLALDRWLGVEGLMVAVGNSSDNNMDLLIKLLSEKNELGKSLAYQSISNSIYASVDLDIFQTGTIPGAVGFFYFSGSMLVVAIGLFFLAMLVVWIERAIFFFTKNIFLVAHMGMWLANSVAQFGLSPRQLILTLTINLVFIFAITLVQSHWLNIGYSFKLGQFLRAAKQDG